MSALSDLQKKLEQEAQGIMFPFSASAANVSTTQNVYDSATDGIMTMQGQKYVGPDAVIQYGSEEQGFPRQLKQIEAPMLPQFDETQFPKAGEGIMQTPTPAPTSPTTPVEPEPETPAVDPCPPGFRYDPVQKVCVPIEQPKSDRDEPFVDTRTNNQKGRDSLKNFGIKLTGGEDSIFADPEKTKAMFGTKQTIDVRDTPKLASYDDVAARGGLSEEYRQALGPELYDAYEDYNKLKNKEGQIPVDKADEADSLTAKINELEAARQQEQERLKQERLTPTSTGERFGQLPTFTVEDFETGIPNLGPISILANFLGKTFIAPSTIRQLEKNGFIVKTGNKKNDKDEYTLSENGIRSIVQSEVDDDKPRMERSLRQQGFTQKQIDSGQALAEMRKDEGADVDKRVKEYQERESKKYTDKQKNDFMTKVNKNRFKDIGGLKQIKSDKFTGEGFTRGR
jgi:DNA-binding PadR family transcriptional regulator